MTKSGRSPSHYDVLGVPRGASIDHIKDSYRLLTKKTPLTDSAYRVLTDPILRRHYDTGLREREQGETTEQEDDYFVACNKGDWQVLRDRDVEWELQAFLPEGKIRLNSPKLTFGPFSQIEAEEFAERKKRETAPERESANPVQSTWVEYGAPTEMPPKPPVPTQAELQYIAGIEMILGSGVPILDVLETVLNYTPGELSQVCGINLETQADMEVFTQYARWLSDLGAWYKSLPAALAASVAHGLEIAAQGRYKFLVPHLRSSGPAEIGQS